MCAFNAQSFNFREDSKVYFVFELLNWAKRPVCVNREGVLKGKVRVKPLMADVEEQLNFPSGGHDGNALFEDERIA